MTLVLNTNYEHYNHLFDYQIYVVCPIVIAPGAQASLATFLDTVLSINSSSNCTNSQPYFETKLNRRICGEMGSKM